MKNIEKYQSELGEDAVKIILERWYALTLRKIPKQKYIETPDYEIRNSDGDTLAICEVKSCVDANVPIHNPKVSIQELAELSQRREKGHRSKLERHHAKAMSQLSGQNSLPTIVVFVSFDMTDPIDMAMFLQEHISLFPSASRADLYMLVKIHQKIIPSNTFEVKETTQLMHTNELGDRFGHRYLSLSEAMKNKGFLPATFSVEESVIHRPLVL